MDELKVLVEMLAGLPHTVLWVLVGYLIYKLVILGSIYGVLRLLIEKTHDWVTQPKRVEWDMGDITVGTTTKHALTEQLLRLRDRSSYIHFEDSNRLRKAIDLLLEQERAAAKK